MIFFNKQCFTSKTKEMEFHVNEIYFRLEMDLENAQELENATTLYKFLNGLVSAGDLVEFGIPQSTDITNYGYISPSGTNVNHQIEREAGTEEMWTGPDEVMELEELSTPAVQVTDLSEGQDRVDKTKKWSKGEITLLITLRGQTAHKFAGSTRHLKLWAEISTQMQEKGVNASVADCLAKFKNLMHTYKLNKKRKLRSGEARITWEFYELMDEFFGQKHAVSPPKKQLMESRLPQACLPKNLTPKDPPSLTSGGSSSKPHRFQSSTPTFTPNWHAKYCQNDLKLRQEELRARQVEIELRKEELELKRETHKSFLDIMNRMLEIEKNKQT